MKKPRMQHYLRKNRLRKQASLQTRKQRKMQMPKRRTMQRMSSAKAISPQKRDLMRSPCLIVRKLKSQRELNSN